MSDFLSACWRILLLSDYNTRVVLAGTVLLGVAAGLTGVYLLLRKRALLGDAISHATLPGVATIYLISVSAGWNRSLPLLLIGAAVSGTLGGLFVLALRHSVRIREDAALGIVLSVFFGIGISLRSIATQIPKGNPAGLDSFIYGKTASMTWDDSVMIGVVMLIVLGLITAFGKELKLLCFDAEFARSQGWPVLALDTLLIALVVTVTIVGLQAVGLILVIALLIVPAASARFWTHDLRRILWISGTIGGLSCFVGTVFSAVIADLPSGATIVLTACVMFMISFAFGHERGFVWSLAKRWHMMRSQHAQHLLRTVYEQLEADGKLPTSPPTRTSEGVAFERVARARHWSVSFARRTAIRLERQGFVTCPPDATLRLTPRGYVAACQLVRDHRLLEHYFLDQIRSSEGQADSGADYLEHALNPELAWQLVGRFSTEPPVPVPASPHPLKDSAPAPKGRNDNASPTSSKKEE